MPSQSSSNSLWQKKYLIPFALFAVCYFSWYYFVVGLGTANYLFFLLMFGLFFASRRSRQFFYVFLPFFIYLMLYDSLRILHDYNIFEIVNQALYDLEVSLFGVQENGTRISLNEYFAERQHTFLDIYAGVFYISWVPFPLAFTIYLFFKKWEKLAFRFWLAFLITNLLGFIIYITIPAAPPWYYLEFGAQVDLNTLGQAAGLARFDDLTGLSIYKNMYSQSSNVFGALPSMHAAFPLLLTYYSLRYKNWFLTGLFFLSLTGIWFGAVYTSHHYVIDILAGIICAILGLIITESLLNNRKEDSFFNRYKQRFASKTA